MSYEDFVREVSALLASAPIPAVDRQAYYRMVHAWTLRGMGYGLGDHPETSGERHVLELLKSKCACPMVFDVGANVGEWARIAWDLFSGDETPGFQEPAIDLRCFEPSNVARTVMWDRFPTGQPRPMLLHFGLSDATRTAPLHADIAGSGMGSVYPRRLAHFGRALAAEERAEFRRLDEVCDVYAVTHIDLLKIDVEGHEFAVLRGAGEMLTSGAIGMIQWEMGGCNLDSRTTFQDFWYLLAPHYDLFRVVADGLAPIPHYREQDEVYVCSNFVAIWRAA